MLYQQGEAATCSRKASNSRPKCVLVHSFNPKNVLCTPIVDRAPCLDRRPKPLAGHVYPVMADRDRGTSGVLGLPILAHHDNGFAHLCIGFGDYSNGLRC
jgi:hypothetical protein